MKRNLILGLVPLLLHLSQFTLRAAPSDSGGRLQIGDPAPALQQGKYLQGEPVAKFEVGKVYVVEFWATWCGPCRTSIPHLNEIHEKFKEKGLVVIGQDVWERGEKVDATVADFVKGMGSKMTYRVALDGGSGQTGTMAQAWMSAAGQNGIPTAFVVDQTGKIAWIGHPMSGLDDVVSQVLADKFDLETFKKEFASKTASRGGVGRADAKPEKPRNDGDDLEKLAATIAAKPPSPTLPEGGLLAYFPFRDNLTDKALPTATLQNRNVTLKGGALYLNGIYVNSGQSTGYRLEAAVPNLSYSNLTVGFDFWPIDLKPHDVILTCGTSYRWLGTSIGNDNELYLTANNGRSRFKAGVKVTPHAWHGFVCSFDLDQKTILLSYDGKLLPKIELPSDFKLEIIGSPAESRDKLVGFTNYSYGGIFHGFVSELRIYDHALKASEMPNR